MVVEEPRLTLHERALAWARTFCTRMQEPWDAAEVTSLHQRLDGLAIEADARGEEALLSATLALSGELCGFLGRSPPPDRRQKTRLLELIDAMLLASVDDTLPDDAGSIIDPGPPGNSVLAKVAESKAGDEADDGPPAPSTGGIWCVSSDADLIGRLRAALAINGAELNVLAASPGWADALPASGVDCVIVDDESLGTLQTLQRRLAPGPAPAHAVRPTYVALMIDASTAERVRALRAGADHVLRASESPEALSDRFHHLLEQRSQEALSVVIIDDDASQTLFCSSILRRVGVNALCCNDAASGIRALCQELPDVVLIDLHMPDVDGLELTDQLLTLPGSEFVSVLFLSGDDGPDTRFDALTAGADDYLSKPIQPRHLIRAVLAHGKRSQRRRHAAARLVRDASRT